MADANRIEDYAIIGNMVSAALISREGSIDWLCLPRFDSPACFAALLGGGDNGRWVISPKDASYKSSRRYCDDTAVLETTFETSTGVVTLTDFMPLTDDEEKVDIVRIVKGVSGSVEMCMQLIIRFGYGQIVPWVRRRDFGMSAVAGPDAIELHTNLPIHGEDMRTIADFSVKAGETVAITLSYHASHKPPHFVPDRQESLDRTILWWREWVKRGSFNAMPARLRDPVVRSLITLKLLSYAPSGGIIAAPTTSLPEFIGGVRNWDYRFCWLRDSALTLYALLNAGYRDEAEAWRQWLLRAIAGDSRQLRIVYSVDGGRWLQEFEVPWLSGYQNSRPVRIGNAAAEQIQLDIYGELIDTLHAAREAELQPDSDAWALERALLNHLEANWREPDRGIWEVRGEPKAFTHSRLMSWVAFDRAVASIERHGLVGPLERWRGVRDAIHDEICTHGFDANKNSFVQFYGGEALDASLLLMPQLGFLPAEDERVIGTIAAIERELVKDGFVARYSSGSGVDGVEGGEASFLACSFWLVDAYVLGGRLEDAQTLFDRLLKVRNDVGLLSEEYDSDAGRLLGNFPQAYSHIGLINAAHNLQKRHGPAQQRSEKVAPKRAEPLSNNSGHNE